MNNIVTLLNQDGVGVLATDTIYGVVARALSPMAVERVYRVRQRNSAKPCIILISNITQLSSFGINPDEAMRLILTSYWPGPVSIILPCPKPELAYLHRGTNTLAFRLPAKAALRRLIQQTGPLLAPSANPEGLPPSRTLAEARTYFKDTVDFYRRGITTTKPSTLIDATGEQLRVLRP